MTQTPPAPTEATEAPDQVVAPDAAGHDDPAGADAHEHPSDRQYVKIALVLGALTVLEVFTYFDSVHHLGDTALYILLTVMMIMKFVYVVGWFMHLKFDSILFRRIFVAGITLALGVYLVMLTAFRIWGG